ncbi:MAG: hypothetical protein CMI14_09295, partial [Oleispira sp.]|nr:hypothetical protein [Oleispira sp.]
SDVSGSDVSGSDVSGSDVSGASIVGVSSAGEPPPPPPPQAMRMKGNNNVITNLFDFMNPYRRLSGLVKQSFYLTSPRMRFDDIREG